MGAIVNQLEREGKIKIVNKTLNKDESRQLLSKLAKKKKPVEKPSKEKPSKEKPLEKSATYTLEQFFKRKRRCTACSVPVSRENWSKKDGVHIITCPKCKHERKLRSVKN